MLPKIGLYTAGLAAYWAQFDGLRERLLGYGAFIARRLEEVAEVYNFGIVDDPTGGRAAGEYFNSHNVDLVCAHSGTYFTSASALPIHQICGAPLVILNLQPTAAMNYPVTGTGEWLAHCVGCPVPEFCNALRRAGIEYNVVNGLLGLDKQSENSLADEVTNTRPETVSAWEQIGRWIAAAGVKRTLRHARFGFLGNNYGGMLDMYSDFAVFQAQTGAHVEILEMCDLDRNMGLVSVADIERKRRQIDEFFAVSGDSPSDPLARVPTSEQLAWSAKVAAAQERLVGEYNLNALAYYYHGSDNHYEELQSGFIVGHSLLTAEHVPCAGEGDLKTALAMKICDTLGIGGSFSEIVAVDYNLGTIIVGHDGPFHIAISDGRPTLRGMSVYHGKRGGGISVEATVKPGAVTLLGVTQYDGKLKMIISEGEALSAPILQIGNTQTHVKFSETPDLYMDKWFAEAPTHHFALGVGHHADLLLKTASLLGIDAVRI